MLIRPRERLNALDAKSGDGDTGSTWQRASPRADGHGFPAARGFTRKLYRAIGRSLSQDLLGAPPVSSSDLLCGCGDAASAELANASGAYGGAGANCRRDSAGPMPATRTDDDALHPALVG